MYFVLLGKGISKPLNLKDDGSFAITESHLNDCGQVVRVVLPLGAARVMEYDTLGAVGNGVRGKRGQCAKN